MAGPIASAVIIPELEEANEAQHSPVSPVGQKRRMSSVADQESKRPRLNSVDENGQQGKNGTANGRDTATAAPPRRERGRERRLFGAVLGALSQNPASAAQRKRAEIEKRQRAQREAAVQEDDQRKVERAARRKAQREREQKRFERESMRIRHANMRHMANFLQTRAEPRLYYKPWETTEDEDDIIRDQIADAEEDIQRELEEVGLANDTRQEEREQDNAHDTAAEGDPGAEHASKEAAVQEQHPSNDATNDSGPPPKDPTPAEAHGDQSTEPEEAVSGQHAAEPLQQDDPPSRDVSAEDDANKDAQDDNGEEVVEAAEDTVIY